MDAWLHLKLQLSPPPLRLPRCKLPLPLPPRGRCAVCRSQATRCASSSTSASRSPSQPASCASSPVHAKRRSVDSPGRPHRALALGVCGSDIEITSHAESSGPPTHRRQKSLRNGLDGIVSSLKRLGTPRNSLVRAERSAPPGRPSSDHERHSSHDEDEPSDFVRTLDMSSVDRVAS
eukprot:6191998-Pleurochrysis_carterae.AAC.3